MEKYIYKNTDPEIKEVADNRTIEFVITKEVVDRDGDVVEIKGFNTKEFMKNPVVIYGHDYRSLPIGKVVKIRRSGDELLAKVKYAEPEVYSFADTVYKLTKAGYGGAVSVGFIPDWDAVEYPKREKINGKTVRRRIKKAEMIELSQTPVPANQDALATGKSLQKAVEDGIIDDIEYKEYESTIQRAEKFKKLNIKDTAETSADAEETAALKAQVAELELQLKEQKMEEELEDDVYTEILDKMFSGQQASEKEEHTAEHTEDGLDIQTLNKIFEEVQ